MTPSCSLFANKIHVLSAFCLEDEEEEENIPVSEWDAKAAIDTLKKYLRQCEDSKPEIESLKLCEINRFVS